MVVVDIRTPEEFAEGHIAGAINIDYMADGFAEKISELDSSKQYLVHCRSGGRSGRSMASFEDNGLDVLHLNKGIKEWKKSGFPLTQ